KYAASSKIIYRKDVTLPNKVSLPDFVGICSADIYPIKPKENINKYFLAFILKSNRFLEYANKNSGRANIPKINRLDLLKYEIITPSIILQNLFEKVWQNIELLKQKMLTQSIELETQFQALMQRAFKGELGFTRTNMV
ncbi:MAG: restriction endonuclease subunit S, partial [bacterium]